MASNVDKAKFKSKSETEETILLFTNGEGEPKAVNVDRCLDELSETALVNPTLDDSVKNDFIYACPRVPLIPISFSFAFDQSKSASNFEYVDGFQFSYQVLYRNGSTSAIAPYSDVAIAPSIIGLGVKRLGEVDVENVCDLFVPKLGEEARYIRIIVREGNNGNPRVIDEVAVDVTTDVVEVSTSDSFSIVYSFYNDKIGTILSEIDSFKNFDNVPRSPKAQTVADGRVMYGNYKEGYPNLETDVSMSVEFNQAPPPGYSFDLKVVPYLFNKVTNKIDEFYGNEINAGGGIRIKTNSGFLIDTSGFPNNVPSGSYTVDITLSPRNNFHLFYGLGDSPVSDNNIEVGDESSVVEFSPDFSSKTRERGRGGTGAVSQDKALGKNAFLGTNDNSSDPIWNSSNSGSSETLFDVGNSYSSPLILKGQPIFLSTTIRVDSSASREDFSKALLHGLCGLSPTSNPISSVGQQISPTFTNDEYFKEVSYDLDLQDNSEFSSDDSSLANMVTAWSRTNESGADREAAAGGFFIVNKATMRFVTEPAKGYNSSEDESMIYKYNGGADTGYGVILSFAHAKDVECKTVVPIPDGKWASAADPSIAASSLVLQSNDPSNTKRARRYFAMGSGQWDWREGDDGDRKISWPSCRRMWKTPDGDFNGPAYLQHASASTPCFGDTAQMTNGATVNLSGAKLTNAGNDAGLSCQVPGDDGYHPAPIDKWLILGSAESDITPSNLSQAYWNGKKFRVNCDVPHSTSSAEDFLVVGDPSDMLGSISRDYCGYVSEGNDNDGVFKLGRDIPFNLPLATTNLDTYLERGTFSLIDGSFGPGGMDGFGARVLNNREDNSIWGDPLAYGYHSGSLIDKNTIGRMANGFGSVTNFSLLGFRDNLPGLQLNEIVNANISTRPELFGGTYNSPRSELRGTSWVPVLGREASMPNDASPSDIGFWSDYYTSGFLLGGIDEFRPGSYYDNQLSINDQKVQVTFSSAPSTQSRGASIPIGSATINTSSDSLGYTSYKTKANHEFGLVYYDERGRHGAVQPLSSVYVPGYDDLDRGESYDGAAKVVMQINHAPPSWAKHYRVVYGGNSSVSEFIQYTAENAFVPATGPNKNRIYVSLNHLQASEISYAENYGAVSQDDNSKDIYKFADGDRLRIINYSTAAGEVANTPFDFDFRVVGYEILSQDMEDHPFPAGAEGNPRLNGEFVVIENNEDADGFSVFDIKDFTDLWGNRCLFEIYRPFSAQGDEARRYFETNYGGEIIAGDNGLTHQFNTIKMTKGDVFFRGTPMNVQTFASGEYSSLLSDTDEEGGGTESASNFVPYYVETEGFTDLYESKSKNYGRVHFADRFASEVTRGSSISFSEQTSQGSYDLRYFSFPQIGSFKDLPVVHGDIDYLDFEGTYIMSFNDSKLYRIPVSRDILQTGGTDSIVASLKVLGKESVIPFDGGSSGRPESIVSVNNDFFFFDERNERLVMIASGKSPVVITDINADSYFREEVKKWKASGAFKAPIGYDPSRSELIFSLHDDGESTKRLQYTDAKDKMITMAFDLKSKKFWKTRYTFTSPHYSNLNECLVSFHKDLSSSNNYVVPYIHDTEASRNKFFGKTERSSLCVSSNQNPSKVKEYNVIMLDSDSRWEANVYTKSASATIPKESFKRYNDKWYSSIDSFIPTVSGNGINRAKSSDVTLKTAPISESNVKTYNNTILKTQFSGPKSFVRVGDEAEIRIPMPTNSGFFKLPTPVGKKSKIYESLQGESSMYPLGHYGVHGLQLGAYVHGEEKVNKTTSNLIVRLPFLSIIGFASSNGMSDVSSRLGSIQDGDTFVLDQSQNDVTGTRIFDLIFAPFYSTKFGIGAEEVGSINSLIAADEGDPLDSVTVISELEWDLDENGNVGTSDLLALLAAFGLDYVTSDLLALLSQFGQTEEVQGGGTSFEVISDVTEAAFNNLYNGERKNIHVAYQPSLNTQELTGRYLKVELVSDEVSDDAELFEIGVDYDNRVKSMSRARKPQARQRKKK